MITKTYRLVPRQNNASFIVSYGKLNVRYNFTNGNVVISKPAMFSTSNPFYQKVLEESDIFKRGIVRLAHTVSDDAPGNTDGSSLIQVTSVTTVTQAIDYIADNYQQKVTNYAQASVFASQHGFCFPNIKKK